MSVYIFVCCTLMPILSFIYVSQSHVIVIYYFHSNTNSEVISNSNSNTLAVKINYLLLIFVVYSNLK